MLFIVVVVIIIPDVISPQLPPACLYRSDSMQGLFLFPSLTEAKVSVYFCVD